MVAKLLTQYQNLKFLRMKKDKIFLKKYFNKINDALRFNDQLNQQILKTKNIFKIISYLKKSVDVIGQPSEPLPVTLFL